ncbi:TPA: hypothetical protein HA238_05000 [Candidatus Micrarchaeota archaeon]|nr:hypothetical protein [Candidatus Micrarchaeota archaeon]
MQYFICPRCGAKSSEKEFIDSFCVDCSEVKIKSPKENYFKIVRCKQCERALLKGEWQKASFSDIEAFIASKFKGEYERAEYSLQNGAVTFYVKKGEKIHSFEKRFKVDVGTGTCPDCGRISGGYYEAIIQVRTDDGNKTRIAQYATALEKRLSEKTFVSKVDEKKEGTDLYIGSSKAVVQYLHNSEIRALITRKLFGRREGRRLYRTTFLIRI